MATKWKCERCETECTSERGWKRHMTMKHGAYDTKEEASAGGTGIRAEARSVLGDSSLADVASDVNRVPGEGPRIGDESGSRKSRRTREERDQEEKRLLAFKRIGGALCRKVATIPYNVWAAVVHRPEMALSDEEAKELTDSYLQLLEGTEIDFSNPKWALMAIMAINIECIARRIPHFKQMMDEAAIEEQPVQ
jgi:hypothetical protein